MVKNWPHGLSLKYCCIFYDFAQNITVILFFAIQQKLVKIGTGTVVLHFKRQQSSVVDPG
jgi:hypothetical protein